MLNIHGRCNKTRPFLDTPLLVIKNTILNRLYVIKLRPLFYVHLPTLKFGKAAVVEMKAEEPIDKEAKRINTVKTAVICPTCKAKDKMSVYIKLV